MSYFLSRLWEGLNINDLKVDFLNSLLSIELFNLAFLVFCLAILINGSNFLDGLNGLLSGYYLIVMMSLFILDYHNDGIFLTDKIFLKIIFFSLLLFLFLIYWDMSIWVIVEAPNFYLLVFI